MSQKRRESKDINHELFASPYSVTQCEVPVLEREKSGAFKCSTLWREKTRTSTGSKSANAKNRKAAAIKQSGRRSSLAREVSIYYIREKSKSLAKDQIKTVQNVDNDHTIDLEETTVGDVKSERCILQKNYAKKEKKKQEIKENDTEKETKPNQNITEEECSEGGSIEDQIALINDAKTDSKNTNNENQISKPDVDLSGFAKKGSKEDEARMQKEREARRAARAAAVQGEGSSSGKPAVKRRETKVGKLGSSSREGSDNKVLTLTQKLSRQGTDMGLNKIAKTTDDSKKKEEDGKLKLSEEAVDKLLEMADIFFNVKSSIMEQTQIIDEQEEIIAECEYAVDCLEKLNSTTQLLWKISDFGLKCKKKILYSPAFATHNQGYQIALSLCPQGDGRAKGRYMSIFFCILHGPWDGLLSWPFTHTLTFTVVDQNPDESKRRDLSVSFTPNPNPQSMQFLTKPTSQRNASLGLPRFVPIADIWNGTYIVEDNLFIKVTVDLTDIPRL